jgi:hypothetical protein
MASRLTLQVNRDKDASHASAVMLIDGDEVRLGEHMATKSDFRRAPLD